MSNAVTSGTSAPYYLHTICSDILRPLGSFRCLAHIVNLATQAVISVPSKSRYYNGNPDDDHIPDDLAAPLRDEIGIIRAICIKVCPTSNR
jgi:hypothetical protein